MFHFPGIFFFSQQKHTALLNLSVDEQQHFTIKYILRKYCELNSKQKVQIYTIWTNSLKQNIKRCFPVTCVFMISKFCFFVFQPALDHYTKVYTIYKFRF